MEDLEEEFGDVADKEVHIKAWFHDWEWDETQNGTARTRIVRDGVRLRTIGRKLRTFKPDIPFTVYVRIHYDVPIIIKCAFKVYLKFWKPLLMEKT